MKTVLEVFASAFLAVVMVSMFTLAVIVALAVTDSTLSIVRPAPIENPEAEV